MKLDRDNVGDKNGKETGKNWKNDKSRLCRMRTLLTNQMGVNVLSGRDRMSAIRTMKHLNMIYKVNNIS